MVTILLPMLLLFHTYLIDLSRLERYFNIYWTIVRFIIMIAKLLIEGNVPLQLSYVPCLMMNVNSFSFTQK